MDGSTFGLLGSRVDHDRRFVDGRNQLAQFLDRIVERIGDRARNIFGNGRFHSQVAVCEAAHFIQQPQDSLLITFILLALIARLALEGGHAHVQQNQRDNKDDREQDQPERNPGTRQYPRQSTARATTTERVGQLICGCRDLLLGGAEPRQLSAVPANRVDICLEIGDQCSKRFHNRRLAVRIQWHDIERTGLSRECIARGTQVFGILGNGRQRRASIGIASQPGRSARDIARALLHFLDDCRGAGARKQLVGQSHDFVAGFANAAGRLDRRTPAQDSRCP